MRGLAHSSVGVVFARWSDYCGVLCLFCRLVDRSGCCVNLWLFVMGDRLFFVFVVMGVID